MISALMIGAQQCHPQVPPTCAQQCAPSSALAPPSSAPTCATLQCRPPVPPTSAAQQCRQ
ncbi:unnamed protein product, partial [Staurois parvus]